MKTLLILTCMLLASSTLHAQSIVDGDIFARSQAVTRNQVKDLGINEHELIDLAKINHQVMPLYYAAKTDAEVQKANEAYRHILTPYYRPEQIELLLKNVIGYAKR
jgi:hypothetical protein